MNLSRPFSRLPLVSFLLIFVNVALFVFELSRGVSAMKPATVDMIGWGANVAALTLNGESWRLLSSMFLHIGLLHIAFNMYMLFV
ncbi:MAG: rhomboid family intramembrane serine protease, partial [Oxalobacteraceae bacterium]